MSITKPSEAEIAAVVVRWYEALGYDVYQEVELSNGGARADIVMRRGPELTIVETKSAPSLALLYQGLERRRCAHRVYLAVPHARWAFRDLVTETGLGLLEVNLGTPGSTWDVERVVEVLVPRRLTSKRLALAGKLKPEHKTAAAAGSQTGGHWSRWRDTCAQLARVVAANPDGITTKLAMSKVSHHYRSAAGAVSTMSQHVHAGRVAGVRIKSGVLFPTEAAK